MNNCDERIEKLLNRAGQTISDLPRKQGESVSEPYSGVDCQKANGTAWRWYLNIDTDMDDYDSTRSKMILKLYILHLTDIIDRMETALENVCGDRDYLRQLVNREAPCSICVYEKLRIIDEPCNTCLDDDEGCPSLECFEYAGVPEGWSVDDD